MQAVVDSLRKKGKIYKNMLEIKPKDLGIRNKITIYKATDLNGYFWIIIAIKQKTRLLLKDVEKYENIFVKAVNYCEHNFKHKVLFVDAPICSKAKESFKKHSWKIY